MQKLNKQNERFSGEFMLNAEDELDRVRQRLSSWTDVALKMFARHQLDEDHRSQQHTDMLAVNEVCYCYRFFLNA